MPTRPPYTYLTIWQPMKAGAVPGSAHCFCDLGDGTFAVGGDWDYLLSPDGSATLEQPNLARFARATRAPVDFPTAVDGPVYALAAHGGLLHLGGYFDVVNEVMRRGTAALALADAALDGWNCVAGDGPILALAIDPATGLVFIGGEMTHLDGQARRYIGAASLATGDVDPAWNPKSESVVRKLAVDGGWVYVASDWPPGTPPGGAGQVRGSVCRLDATTGLRDAGWDLHALGIPSARTFHLAADAVWVGGAFGASTGCARNHVAAISKGSPAAILDPDADLEEDLARAVTAMGPSPDGATLYIGVSPRPLDCSDWAAGLDGAGDSAAGADPSYEVPSAGPGGVATFAGIAVSAPTVIAGDPPSATPAGADAVWRIVRLRLYRDYYRDGPAPDLGDPALNPYVDAAVIASGGFDADGVAVGVPATIETEGVVTHPPDDGVSPPASTGGLRQHGRCSLYLQAKCTADAPWQLVAAGGFALFDVPDP